MSTKDSEIWNSNAAFWDGKMGDTSNDFHNHVVRPATEKLLNVKKGDFVLDISCGNGNYSKRLAEQGAKVVGFDFSEKLIDCAKKRCEKYLDSIEFCICDATDINALRNLKREKAFNKAVSNMAIMDISNIEPLFKGVSELLCDNGIFVFTSVHPCFSAPEGKYLSQFSYKGEAINGQPVLQNYYHRSLDTIFNLAFSCGFIIDGFCETPFNNNEIPAVITVRLKKRQRDKAHRIIKSTCYCSFYSTTADAFFKLLQITHC